MTVAAVVLFARVEAALADAGGRSVARRTVESAWAGGATPIVVESFDPEGTVANTLAGSPAVLAEPAPRTNGPVGQIIRAIKLAADAISDTEAALVWPGQMAWVDAETVTTLIEAHGVHRDALLRPRYADELGWPALIPISLLPALSALAPDRTPDELLDDLITGGASLVAIDTGDPGTTHDISTSIDALPEYEGPPQPVAGNAPEWGAAAAEMPDDVPLEGPALAPYGQATDEGD